MKELGKKMEEVRCQDTGDGRGMSNSTGKDQIRGAEYEKEHDHFSDSPTPFLTPTMCLMFLAKRPKHIQS